MIKLKKIEILKYKSFTTSQTIEIEDDLTVLVGMNESGKTSILECLAKTNYFEDDSKFSFNQTLDYPRKEKKLIDKTGKIPEAISCTYELTNEAIKYIELFTGEGTWAGNREIVITTKYDGSKLISGVKVNFDKFIELKLGKTVNKELTAKLKDIRTKEQFEKFKEDRPDELDTLRQLDKYFFSNSTWDTFIEDYAYRIGISRKLPKFIYYDEYYQLPSRIVLENLINKDDDEEFSDELKTAKALLDLAEIDINELI